MSKSYHGQFVGGPWNGQCGTYEHPNWQLVLLPEELATWHVPLVNAKLELPVGQYRWDDNGRWVWFPPK